MNLRPTISILAGILINISSHSVVYAVVPDTANSIHIKGNGQTSGADLVDELLTAAGSGQRLVIPALTYSSFAEGRLIADLDEALAITFDMLTEFPNEKSMRLAEDHISYIILSYTGSAIFTLQFHEPQMRSLIREFIRHRDRKAEACLTFLRELPFRLH